MVFEVKLSLVVVNFHSIDYLRRCLKAVSPSWCSCLVVVDNSEDPREAETLAGLSFPVPYHLLVEESNGGFGTAANHGVDYAFRSHPESPVWLLNPDTVFSSATPAALIDRLKLSDDDIISPPVVTGTDDDLRIWFAGGTADRSTYNVVHDDYLAPYSGAPLPDRPTTFMCGAAPVFTPTAWSKLGGFRSDLFLYWEDAELSLRAQDAGLRMTVLGSSAPVWHAVGGTGDGTGQSAAFYFYSARNRLKLLIERRGYRALSNPRILAQLCKFTLRALRNEKAEPVKKFMATWSGYATALGTRSEQGE